MTTRDVRLPRAGLLVTLVLVAVAFAVPPLTGWDVHSRAPSSETPLATPPLHGFWDPKLWGPGTLPALVVAVLGVTWFPTWARTAPWRRLLVVAYLLGLAWLFSLALVDGVEGLTRVLDHSTEYLASAREVTSVPDLLHTYIDRIPYSAAPDNWPTQPAGHPPLALLFFVGLVQVGLGGDLAAAVVVVLLAAVAAVAVLDTVRTLGAEDLARRAAPFLVLTPAAVFLAVSADAVFSTVAACGLAALARGAVAAREQPRRGSWWAWWSWSAWSTLAGLLLGAAVMMSYGLPLIGLVALAVLAAARAWRPLPVAAAAALVVVLGFAAAGFAWWEAYPVLHDRYWDGIAGVRPAAYWMWGNLAALAVSAGPLLGAALAYAAPRVRDLRPRDLRTAVSSEQVVLLLALGGTLCVVAADLSRMSKAEVERIWLPFMPWMTLACALLPPRWQRAGLVLQVGWAVVVQQLLYTSW